MSVKVKVTNDRPGKMWTKADEIELINGVANAIQDASAASPDGRLYLDEFFRGPAGPAGGTLLDWVESRIVSDQYAGLYAEFVDCQNTLSDLRHRLERAYEEKREVEARAGADILALEGKHTQEMAELRAHADRAIKALDGNVKLLQDANKLLQRAATEHEAEHKGAKRALSAIKRYLKNSWASKAALDHNIMRDTIATHEEIARASREARRSNWDEMDRIRFEDEAAEFYADLNDGYHESDDEYDYEADDRAYDAARERGR